MASDNLGQQDNNNSGKSSAHVVSVFLSLPLLCVLCCRVVISITQRKKNRVSGITTTLGLIRADQQRE